MKLREKKVAMEHEVHVAGRELTRKLLDNCSKEQVFGNELSHLNCGLELAKECHCSQKIAPSELGKMKMAPSDLVEMKMDPSDLEESWRLVTPSELEKSQHWPWFQVVNGVPQFPQESAIHHPNGEWKDH